jgi:lysylphosphatidylglycerol synthetase-like protein (DUF2156 family)
MKSIDKLLIVRIIMLCAIVSFLMPFLMVSCGDSNLGTFTGMDLISGRQLGEYQVPLIPTILAAFALLVLALIFTFIPKKWTKILTIILPGVSSVLLLLTSVMVELQLYDGLVREEMEVALVLVTIKWQWGFYAALIFCLLSMLCNLAMLFIKTEKPKQTGADE